MVSPDLFFKTSQNKQLVRKSLNWILQAFLLITAVCLFVPFYPVMPGENLDLSWAFGVNQAVAQGLVFGRDMVFTFGPYASIFTRMYHPATDHLMLAGGLYLGVSYGVAVLLLTKNGQWPLVFAFLVVLAGLMNSPDAHFFSYPLLVGLICSKLIDSRNGKNPGNKLTIALIVILFLPFGLLPLIKGSFLILCGSIIALSATLFLINREWRWAIAVVAVPTFSTLFFWVMSGQSVLDLSHFFISMVPIVSGYTEAMATGGEKMEILCYLVAAILLLIAVLREKGTPFRSRVFLFCIFFVFLFVAFKNGFVRHDGHAIGAGTCILMAALLFSLTFKSRQIPVVLLVSAFAWMYIDSHYNKTSVESVFRNVHFTYSSAWNGLKNRISQQDWPENDFNSALLALKEKANFPVFQGTTDIYSYSQSYLIASGNLWNPRPILQSYSAYTSSLMEMNKDHLLGPKSPDNVIFRVEPIDNRIPSLEDAASWPVLLKHYQPTALGGDFLYLRKQPPNPEAIELSARGNAAHAFEDVVPVPRAATPLFAEISINQSIPGKLANLLFKLPPLQISLNLENGESRKYNLIASMAKSSFMLSPLVENTYEFGLLYVGSSTLTGKGVTSFSIAPSMGRALWKDTYQVVFKQLDMPSTFDVSMLDKLDEAAADPASHPVSIAEKCDGSIDFVNGVSPAPARFTASGVLGVRGWLAKSVDQGALAESVLLVLSDSNGKRIFIRTRQASRPDLGVHFKKPALNAAGYTSTADVSTLDGNYTLGLAFKEGGHIKICPQFKMPAEIKRFSMPSTAGRH